MLLKRQMFARVDIESIELQLSNAATPESAVDELYKFGAIMFSEIQQRCSDLDSKLTTVLTLSIAVLGFVLANKRKIEGTGDYRWIGFYFVAALTLLCLILSAYALKTKMWQAPSERDWFKDDLLSDASMLKRYHVVSMLTTHQTNGTTIVKKATYLAFAECVLAICAALVFISLLFS